MSLVQNKKRIYSFFMQGGLFIALLLPIHPSLAQSNPIPRETIQAVVIVQCADRQGSGTVINNVDNYVLTNAHVVMNVETGVSATTCRVGFLEDPTQPPVYFYRAEIVKKVFQPEGDLDFAILKIGQQLTQRGMRTPFPMLTTNEFPQKNDPIQVAGFSGAADHLVIGEGTIQSFEQGFIQTTAQLSPGNSGGAAVDSQNHLIGIPTRIVTFTNEDHSDTHVTYDLVDIRAVMNWLDLYGTNEHDRYFSHANYQRYHLQQNYTQDADLGCEAIVKLTTDSAVYCLITNNQRLIFPSSAVFRSWFPDFSDILTILPSQLVSFKIKENARFKPGTLVKSATSPKVYVVIDNEGTLRWIPTEDRAISLWGSNWANLVKDIPDEFWFNYQISSTPIE